jgi:hypothetical protein
MPMKLRKIEYHLARAGAARAAIARGELRPGARGKDYASLVEHHEAKAAELLADGLRWYAGLAQTKGARKQRRRRRRLGPTAEPRTPADRVGRGRGRHGERWGVAAPERDGHSVSPEPE